MWTQLLKGIAFALVLGCLTAPTAAQSPRMILALGSIGFLDPKSIETATGAVVKLDMEKSQLKDFSVVVLANVPFTALPGPVQQEIAQYVNGGGAVLITGGSQSFGSGGYQAVSPIIPFEVRSGSDWRGMPFRLPVLIQPSHSILAGVSFISVGNLNDMNPRRDATEIMQAAGGGSAPGRAPGTGGAGGGSYPYPLIAELSVGAGCVLGIAFDLNEFGGMRDRDLFVRNTMAYLLSASRITPTK